MVEGRNITVMVGDRTLLDDVSIAIAPGELVALIGPNGAGKSTLLKTLGGLIAADSGIVQIDELEVTAATRQEQARRRAVMSQRSSLDFSFTTLDVVVMGCAPHAGREGDREIAATALERVGGAPLADRNYTSLSGGESRRVDLARAFAQIRNGADDRQRYLFLDEPTASLDLGHQHAMMRVVRRATEQGVGVLAVLHDLNVAAEFADRIVLMSAGRILIHGSAWQVVRSRHLAAAFGIPIMVTRHPCHDRPLLIIGAEGEASETGPEDSSRIDESTIIQETQT